MKKTVLAFAFAGFAAAASAAPETYSIDPKHSASRFGYDMFNGWTFQLQRFDQTNGTITLDREAKTGSVDVTIDAKSINTGIPAFNGQLQDAEFFDTAKHPTITYKSTGVKFDGDKVVRVDGDLTIKGITKPVTLTVTSFVTGQHPVQTSRQAMGANAVAKVKRSDFKMTKQPLVADEVELSFTIQAFKN